MRINPVLRRELIERWRGTRAAATVTVYLAVLGGVLYLLYRLGLVLLRQQMGFGFGMEVGAGPALGRFLFEGLMFFVLLMVLFVSPGYAAAQVSGERERRTLPLLQLTLLRPYEIVLGMLGASVAWLLVLITVTVPLAAATLFLGGVSLIDVLRAGAFILLVAVSIAAVALGISALTRRTTASIVLTYATVLALTGGTLFLAGFQFVVRSNNSDELRTPSALYLNPFFGLADAADALEPGFGFGLPSPLGLLAAAMPDSTAMRQTDMAFEEPPGFPGGPAVLARPDDPDRQPVWLRVGGWYLLLGVLGLLLATRRMRTIRAPARVPRRRPGRAAQTSGTRGEAPAGSSGGAPA